MDTKRIVIVGGMLIAAGVIFTQVRKMGTPAPVVTTTAAPEIIVEKVKYVKVLAAAEPLNTGQRLSERSITTIQWPAEALNANIISVEDNPDASAVFINSLARQPIGEGETLTRSKVIMAGDSGVMAALLKPGMRAVTTRISVDTAAGGFIQPGDRVDIILRENFSVPQRANNNAQGNNQSRGIQRNSIYMANILFENVKVLAIDQTFSSGPEVGASLVGSIATFELSPSDAELLQEAEGYGDIYLTLRGANNSTARAKSRAKVAREEGPPPASSLTIYRNGQPTSVALQER